MTDGNNEHYETMELTRSRLHEQIADKIQEMVSARKLKPGGKLPPDRQLAEMLQVSRPTVREALHLLEHRGLITMKPGSGSFVSKINSQYIVQSVDRFFSMTDCSFEDLLQVRELIEPGAAALAATNANAEQRTVLTEKFTALDEAFKSGNPKRLATTNAEFHKAIASASGNQLLAAMSDSIAHLVAKWTEQTSAEVFNEDTDRLHTEILQAIMERESERARAAAATHVQMSRKAYQLRQQSAEIT
jgi:GntR family transcriptional repressor for pyruvate dehydrogenase complex